MSWPSEGIKHLKKKKYDDAIETFEKVKDRYPYSEQALLAQIKLADAYFYKKKYDEALPGLQGIRKAPPHQQGRALLRLSPGALFLPPAHHHRPGPDLHPKGPGGISPVETEIPRLRIHPQGGEIYGQCRRDLAEHEYYIAEFYFKTKRYQAALERYQAVAQEYPEFPKKAEVQERIEECQKILATADKKPQGGFFSPITNLFDAKW